MHHTIRYHLAQARLAGLRHHAQRDTLAPPSWPAPLGAAPDPCRSWHRPGR